MVSPSVATATAVCSWCVLPLSSSSWRRAASMLSGLEKIVVAERQHLVAADHKAFGASR